jgi:hypothetical protein
MIDAVKTLVEEIEAFCREEELSETAFGRSAVNDPNLCRDLRNGRSPSLSTVEKIKEFMKPAKKRAANAA